MKRQIRIFLAGVLVIAPLAVTAYVVWVLAAFLDGIGGKLMRALGAGEDVEIPFGVGVLLILGIIYLVGLLTHLWVFRGLLGFLDRTLCRLPGIKVIYESVRDLMQLFGGNAERMGKVVRYRPPGSEMDLMGIQTNARPLGIAEEGGEPRVAVYLPYAYMFGGPTIYVSPEHVQEVPLSVDQALKIAATAHVGAEAPLPQAGAAGKSKP